MMLEDFGGESLEKWMQDSPQMYCPIPLPVFLRLAVKIAEILGRIHATNVIHKDINPSNIVLNPGTGQVKIIDFGIATRFTRTNPSFKSPHVLEGTLAYLSPEQTGRMNRLLDYRTDFYSLGVTFYELLTGHLPFPTTDMLELVHCHIARPPVPPDELNPAIPKAISDMILKLMAKNAEDRYQSAWGIKADLESCAQQLEAIGQVDGIQLGLQDVSEQFHISQKLYGRETEVAALVAVFDRVAGSGNAENSPFNVEMMLVSGYAGIGKSALVQELYKPITAKRGYFISGKFDQFQRNSPYSAIVDALRKLVQQLLGEPDEQLQRWRSRLLTALGTNGQIIIDVIPEVELIIDKQPPVPEVGATEAQNRFNRVFQQFVRVFCSEEHPLVIFLDDLQWVDSVTLKLIELMLLDEQTHYLFLIGAYRDNEVSPTHPLVLTLERLRKQGTVLPEIVLTSLTMEPLSQLIAETLHHNADTVRSLAELVLHKTEGNPFFINEFLKTLYAEDCLMFNFDRRNWQWDIEQIQAKNITDNVVVLTTNKLIKLPESIKQILQLAACVGNEFDLDTLSIIYGTPARELFSDLVTAVQTGLILPTSELDENLLIQNYKFLHDRVQQAAYTLIDESHKQVVHLQIGRSLLEKTLPGQISDRLFEIVNHLNHGIEIVSNQPERNEIARLNLIAGQKAKAAMAYEAALKYFNTGLKLLNPESWLSEYDLTLALYSEAAGAAYLQGCFSEMEHFVEVVLNRAKTVLDKVQVYDSRIQGYLSQGNLKEALKIGLEVIKLLGVILPENPSQLDVQKELEETAALIAGLEIENLINLPEMTAPEPLAAMSILADMGAAAFMVSPALKILIVCKKVSLSVNYGNTTWSPYTYVAYGHVLCGVVQDIELSYKFVKLALSLAERSNTKKGHAKALTVSSAIIMPWKLHIKETIPFLVNAYQTGVETGDFEFVGYAAYNICQSSFFAGEELTQLEQKTAVYSKAIRQIRRETPSNWIAMLWQTVLNLLDRSENPSRLIGRICNEDQALPRAITVKDGSGINYFYLYKIILCYLFGEYHQAAQAAVSAKQQFEQITAITIVPLFYLYDSLVLLSLPLDASNSEKAAWLSCVNTNQEKIQKWANHAPMNYLHKFHLVEAEKARVLGQFFEAEEFYEQAIQGARDNEYIQEEALAYELAAKFYLARSREKIAQTYMKEAHYCYERWGATAKVKDLETRYPQFFPQSSGVAHTLIHTAFETISTCLDSAFDLAAVLKASQAISSEIELDRLLGSLMQILIENAGAQTGFLILENSGEWVIEAACELNEGEQDCATRVLQSIPMANRLPESIIQYVIRTHETVILNDATREGNFINEPYIQHHQTQSLLCLPLLNQSKLVGVLYLENQLATGAFTPERSHVLHLLSTQAAIAIENARLYSRLRASESRMTQFLEAIPVGIAVVDTAGRPYYFNQRATQLLGKEIDPSLTPDQLAEVYQTYLAGTDQTYPTERMPIIQALSGERTTVDDLEIHQNSAIIPVEMWGTPIFDERGNVAYALAAFQDITQRRQAEQLLADYNRTLEQQVAERTAALQRSEAELRDREQELRLITDALPVCISYVDANRCYRFVNHTYEDWFSRSRDQILGKHVREILGEKAYQVLESCINQVFAGQTVTMEVEMPLPFGKKYINTTLIPDFDGNAQVRGFYALNADISDYKRAEAALQASEAELRALFTAVPDPLFVLTAEGRVIEAVEVGADRLYKPIEEQVGKTLHEIFSQEQADEFLAYTHQVLSTQQVLTVEYSLPMAGQTTWFSTRIAPIRTNQVIWLARDITQRKQAEEALQRSEAKFRNIFENSQVGIFRTRLSDGLILDANQRLVELFGFDSPDEIIGIKRTTDFYVNPVELHKHLGELQIFDKHVRNIEVQIRKRNGTLFWGLYSFRLNTADGYMECVIADINDRKQAEAALQASETELQTLFAAIPDPLWVLTAEGQVLDAVEREPNQLYKPIEEQVGKTLHQIFAKEQADEFLDYIQQVLRTQQMLTVEYSLWIAGRKTWFSARIAPIRHEQVIWLARDITDRKRAEAASILEERNHMAREIHDTLAQTFTGIIIHARSASNKVTVDPEKAQTLLTQVLDLARSGLAEARRSVEALRRPYLLESSNLQAALSRLAAQLDSSIATQIVYEVIGTTYPLSSDLENNLFRIGQEALTNAIKHAKAHEIRIELVYEPTQCSLRIKDDGQGFDVENQAMRNGFGLLGMAERAERIRAELKIQSHLGQGTEIVVSIDRE
jgi:PAS domain S-box-containing protein